MTLESPRHIAACTYARRNFMVPIPNFASWDEFNLWLRKQCRKRQRDRLRGESETISERLQRDLAAMRPQPASPFEACDQASGRVSSQALVRYRTNDYSVPAAFGHQDVWIRGYVDEVVIGCGEETIARHPRSYEREEVVFDPLHYLPLIEQKINALDQAALLQGWELRRLMARMDKQGRRTYVQVLRLLESLDLADLHAAVRQALHLGAVSFDAVKHLVLCRAERRPPKLDLDIYPYLPRTIVETTSAKAYMRLRSHFDAPHYGTAEFSCHCSSAVQVRQSGPVPRQARAYEPMLALGTKSSRQHGRNGASESHLHD